MPLRPLGSPAPHKVCSPYRQTQSTRSEQQAGEQGQPCFSPLPTSLLGLTPSPTSYTATSLSLVIPFVKCVGFSLTYSGFLQIHVSRCFPAKSLGKTEGWGFFFFFFKSSLKVNEENQAHCQLLEMCNPLPSHRCSASPVVSKLPILAQF